MIKEEVKPCRGGEDCNSTLHLCRLVDRTHDYERVKMFVRDPAYFCRNCCRVAHDPQHLCKPVLL